MNTLFLPQTIEQLEATIEQLKASLNDETDALERVRLEARLSAYQDDLRERKAA